MKEVKLFFNYFSKEIQKKLKNQKRIKEIIQRIISTTGKYGISKSFSVTNLIMFSLFFSISSIVLFYNKEKLKTSILEYIQKYQPKQIKKIKK